MSAVAGYGRAALAILERDLRIFLTYRNRVIAEFASIVFSITIFYYVARMVRVEQFPSPDDYFAFVVVGLVIIRTLFSAYTTFASTLRQELVAGTFERMVASPFGPLAGTVAMLLFPFAHALVISSLSIGFAAIVFGVPLHWSTLALALPAALLAVLAFVPFALIIGAMVIVYKQAAGSGLFLAVIALVSGLVFPVDLLPGWLQWASEVQPFTPAVELLRHLIVDTPLQESVTTSLLKVVAFVAVLLPLSLYSIKKAIEHSRRRATLIEY